MEAISPYFPSSPKNSSLPSAMTIANRKSRKRTNDESVAQSEAIGSQLAKLEPEAGEHTINIVTNGYTQNDVTNTEVKKEIVTHGTPAKKKRDRFNGTTEEEVMKMTLPDRIKMGLDILIIGINPGLTAAYVGHHYAGPGNHFWKCLYTSGLIPEPLTAFQDEKALDYGIGLCNIVNRTTRGSNNLSRKEIKEGGELLKEKIKQYKPKVAVFNGKGIYEVFSGNKKFHFGKQPNPIPETDTLVYVMPSSSARCSQLPRATDKVPFYVALKKLRDNLCGRLPDLKESEVCFPDLELKCVPIVKTEAQSTGGDQGQKGAQKKRSRANGHFVDQNGMLNVSNTQSSSIPNRVMHEDFKHLSNNSSGLRGNPAHMNMGFHSQPIHPAFSTSVVTLPTSVPIPCTASSNLHSASNAQITITSQHGSASVSNNQSQRQSVPKRNEEPTWTRPNVPAVTSSQSVSHAESIAHIPCTSSAVLTSEWINKHFNNPFQPPYNINAPWPTHAEYGINGKNLWHMGMPPAQGYMKHEMPSEGYGSVPPSR